MNLSGLMQKKVMGVPVLYLVAGFVIVLALVAWRMKPGAGVTPDPAEDTGAAPDAGGGLTEGGEGAIPPFVANPSPGYGGVAIPDPNASGGTPDDNDKWLRRAVEWLAGQDHATADAATGAIQKYLAGDQLSVAEGQLRDLAIRQFGLPPEIPQSGGTAAPVTPTPTTPKKYIAPGYHTVSGPEDDSYTDMARLFYGRGDNAAVDLIQSFNPTKGHEGPFPVGTRFWIPPYTAPKYITATASVRTSAQIVARNPPLTAAMLKEFNDGMKFPVKAGTKVRVA